MREESPGKYKERAYILLGLAPEVAASVPTTVEAESDLSATDGMQRMEDTAGIQAVTTRATDESMMRHQHTPMPQLCR